MTKRIAEGNWADLVLFDPNLVADITAYEDCERNRPASETSGSGGQLAFQEPSYRSGQEGSQLSQTLNLRDRQWQYPGGSTLNKSVISSPS